MILGAEVELKRDGELHGREKETADNSIKKKGGGGEREKGGMRQALDKLHNAINPSQSHIK